MNIPQELKYTKEHEWIIIEGNIGTIGITDFAQKELGDIVYIDINSLNKTLKAGEIFGTVEAVKTVSDLYLPMSGKIVAFNTELQQHPEFVNNDPYKTGWIIKIELTQLTEQQSLLSAEQYKNII
ncbi:MAG: glycine cleavage system protein GcvH [Phycisphaerales bacterium]|nr:glycine cleavage system protein GcvH [Phycisphaerales bacterium]